MYKEIKIKYNIKYKLKYIYFPISKILFKKLVFFTQKSNDFLLSLMLQ